jgi:hypothetical protein
VIVGVVDEVQFEPVQDVELEVFVRSKLTLALPSLATAVQVPAVALAVASVDTCPELFVTDEVGDNVPDAPVLPVVADQLTVIPEGASVSVPLMLHFSCATKGLAN